MSGICLICVKNVKKWDAVKNGLMETVSSNSPSFLDKFHFHVIIGNSKN